MSTFKSDGQIIDALGGTSATARLCQIDPASVSDWRKYGIPKARRMFLELARPDVFAIPANKPKKKAATT